MTKLDNIIECPYCEALLDRYTLYGLDCICMECGHFIDIDKEMEKESMHEGYETSRGFWDDEYYDDYLDDDYYLESMKRKVNGQGRGSEDMLLPALREIDEDDLISSFVIRFMTDAKYDIIKRSFEELDGDIEYMELVSDGKLREFLNSKSGQKLAKGLDIKADDLDEYVISASFIFGDANDEGKKTLISTLCHSFPLCIIREEDSRYIMSNNKGLAKGFIETCNEDEVEILSLFLTGFEKYKILCHFLYWIPPYKTFQAQEIMVKWDKEALISLDALRTPKEVPTIWQQFLATVDSLKVSTDDKDPGSTVTFEQMIEDIIADQSAKNKYDDTQNLIEFISLRGLNEYSLYTQDEEDEDDKDAKTTE